MQTSLCSDAYSGVLAPCGSGAPCGSVKGDSHLPVPKHGEVHASLYRVGSDRSEIGSDQHGRHGGHSRHIELDVNVLDFNWVAAEVLEGKVKTTPAGTKPPFWGGNFDLDVAHLLLSHGLERFDHPQVWSPAPKTPKQDQNQNDG